MALGKPDLPLSGGTMTGTLVANDTNFTLRDETDNTKQAQFQLSGITTATTRTYTLPNLTGTLATTGSLSQTFSGTTTFSGTFTASGATVSLGTSTSNSTINVGTGATTGTNSKTIVIGNGHAGTGNTFLNVLTNLSNSKGYLTFGNSTAVGSADFVNYGASIIYSQWTNNLTAALCQPVNSYTGFLDNNQVTYDSKSKSISAEDTAPTGMYFKADGTSVFILGDTNDRVYRYDLSTAWDISTAGAVASTSPSLAAQSTTLSGLTFSPDGTKMFVASSATDLMYQYTLSTAWDLSTVTYANKSVALAPSASHYGGIFFNSAGTQCLYVIGSSVYVMFVGISFDLATAATNTKNSGRLYFFGSSGGAYLCPTTGHFFYSDTSSTDIAFKKIYPDDMNAYGKSITYLGDYEETEGFFSTQSETSIKAVWYNHANKKFYTLGTTNQTIYQHSVGWDTTTSWSTIKSTKSNGVSQHLGYNHFEGGIWYNDVKLDSRLAPAGGTTGQVLQKTSATDYAFEWTRIKPRVSSAASTATLTPNLSTASVFYLTAQSEALTIAAPTGTPVQGETIEIYVKDDGVSRSLSINATYIFMGTAKPTATTVSKWLLFTAQYNGTDWNTRWSQEV